MFVYMGAHDDTWDFTVMQITLEAALKTKYKEQVEAATFKYLRSKEHAEETTVSFLAVWLSRINATQRESYCYGRAGSAEEVVALTQPLTSPLIRLPRQQAWTQSTWYSSSHGTYE